MSEHYQKQAYRVSLCTSAVNALLAVFKLAVGFVSSSSALLSDGVDSACDVFSSFIVMIGVKFASKSPDEDHPYGHERFECISSIVLALIIAASGIGVGYAALVKIFSGAMEAPGLLALAVAAVSIAAKEWMFRFTRRAARRILRFPHGQRPQLPLRCLFLLRCFHRRGRCPAGLPRPGCHRLFGHLRTHSPLGH